MARVSRMTRIQRGLADGARVDVVLALGVARVDVGGGHAVGLRELGHDGLELGGGH